MTAEKNTEANAAIVTGASSGIGAAVVRALAAAGFRVLAAGRDEARLARLAATLADVTQADVTSWAGDLGSAQDCRRLVDDGVRQFGRLDLLVNNAGIYLRGTAEETGDEAWRDTLRINLDAPFFLSRAALPHLRESRGAIINIASDWGLQGGRKAAAYCASKGGLVLLTKGMALDHAREGIRINAVCPGDVDTPMLVNAAVSEGLSHEESLRRYGSDSPSGRVTTAEEVASLVVYLASPAAAQITGAAIPMDGGNTA